MTSDRKGSPVRVTVDAMGGDYAPLEIVKGAVQVAGEDGIEVILVGIEDIVLREIAKYDVTNLSLRVVNAGGAIRDGESPVVALRRRPDASIGIALQLVKKGEADAMVSMGSTGAVMVKAKEVLGTLKGIRRPVMGGIVLGLAPNMVMFDLGANVECKPHQLLNFAVMGCVVARKVLDIANPTVAILSNGAEEGKGNRLVKEAYQLLKNADVDFIGNVEGYDIPLGKANVIVCDGFTGNIVVKLCEALGQSIFNWFRPTLRARFSETEIERIGADLHVLTNIADKDGGGVLYGVDGVVMVGHGHSKAGVVVNAVRRAKLLVERGLVGALKSELEKL